MKQPAPETPRGGSRVLPVRPALAPLLALGLALVTLALFARVAGHAFLHYDDDLYVTANPQVLGGLSWAGLRWAFTSFQVSNWHPLTWISHQLDVQLFGLDAGAHHLVNAALHALDAALLLLLLARLTGSALRSALVAALFAVHPLHVESVAWLSERKDLLSTLFGLLLLFAWAGWARHRSARWYAAALAAFAASLLSKPMWVTAPFLLLLLDLWPLQRWDRSPIPTDPACPSLPRHPARALLLEKLPLILMAAASSAATIAAQAGSGALGTLPLGFGERVANALTAYVAYLAKAAWPAGLSVYYPHRAEALLSGPVLLSALLLVAVSAACVATWRRVPWLLVGWCWFLGTLVPVIGLVQVGGQAMADRYTYLPAIGLFVVAAWGLGAAAERWRAPHAAAGLALAVLLTLSALTWRQLGYWADQETLFRHAVAVTERNAVAHLALSQELAFQGRVAEALPEAEAAVAADTANARAWKNLGYVRFRAGLLDGAVVALERAVALDPDYAEAHASLAIAYQLVGRPADAERERAAARPRPERPPP